MTIQDQKSLESRKAQRIARRIVHSMDFAATRGSFSGPACSEAPQLVDRCFGTTDSKLLKTRRRALDTRAAGHEVRRMENELNRLLAGFPVFCTLPIQWGDQDSFAHVNNTVYFRWIESSRIEYGNRLGFAEMMERSRISPILAATSCNYRRQLIYPDTVDVGTRITKIGRTSMVMEHRIVSRNLQAVAAEGESTLVLFDYGTQHPVEVSVALRKAITELEGPDSPLVQLNSPAG